MARYEWPSPPEREREREGKAALRSEHFQRLWSGVAGGLVEQASQALHDQLHALAAGLNDAQIDLKRWLPLGPSVLVEGGNALRFAGRVRDVKRSPDGTRVYAAAANGGVWFSGDGGRSWAPLG